LGVCFFSFRSSFKSEEMKALRLLSLLVYASIANYSYAKESFFVVLRGDSGSAFFGFVVFLGKGAGNFYFCSS